MKFFRPDLLQNEKFNLYFIAFVASLAMLPVFFKGLPYGNDMPHHFQCAFTFYESFTIGDFYPSWSLNRNMGYGGMESRLYPPISHYTLALFYLASQNWHTAVWLTLTFFTILGSYGIYLWARELMSAPQAVFAACVYAYLPYHLTQVYNTFFYAEFAGAAVLPFSFAYVARVCRRGKSSDVIGLAVAYCALILTHLPLTVIGSVCLAIYALSFFEREKILSTFGKLASAVTIALAGSSFFWTKVLQERHFLAKTDVYPDPYLDYRLHFLLTPLRTFQGLELDIYKNSLFFYDLMFLCAAGLTLFCTIPFILASKSKKNLCGVWFVFSAAVFLATPFSRFIWDGLTLLQEVQFPWRWLTVVCITASILTASRLDSLVEWFRGKKRPCALIISGSILAVMTFSVCQIINPASFIEKDKIQDWIQTTEEDKGFTFWWTPWARKEIFDVRDRVLAGNRNVEIQKWTATERKFQIAAGNATEARVAIFYHPNWKATVNDIPVEIKSGADGAIFVPVFEQSSFVQISFQETFPANISRYISGFVWLCLLLFVFEQGRKKFFLKN